MRLCRSFTLIYPFKRNTTSDWLGVNCRTVWNLCNLQLSAVGSILSRTFNLAVTHSILTWNYLYIPQDFPLHFFIIFIRTSHIFSLSSSSSFPHQLIMALLMPQQGASGLESSRMMNASLNTPPTGTHIQCRHQLVNHDAANAATDNMTQDTHSTMLHKARSSKIVKKACNWMWVHLYRGRGLSTNNIIFSWST